MFGVKSVAIALSVCCDYLFLLLVNKEANLISSQAGNQARYWEKMGRVWEMPAAAREVRCEVTSHEPHDKI